MPINFDYLRRQNLFGPQNPDPQSSLNISSLLQQPDFQQPDFQTPTNYQPVQPTPEPEEDLDTKIQRIFANYPLSNDATDRFTQLLNQFPERNKPGLGRNILSVIAGLGEGVRPVGITEGQVVGFQGGNAEDIMRASDLVRYRPYYDKLQDWQIRAKPLEQAMTNERYFNQNQRSLASAQALRTIGAQNADTREREVVRKESADAQRMTLEWAKYDLRERSVAIREYLKDKPHLQVVLLPGGNMKLINTVTGVITDTGIPSGHPTAIELAQERHKNRMKEIDEQTLGGIQRIQESGIEQRQTQAEKPVTAGRTGNAELEATRGILRRAEEYVNRHPEIADFITVDDKKVTVAPVKGKGYFGFGTEFTAAQRKAAMDYIYGSQQQSTPTPAPTKVPTKTPITRTPTKPYTGPPTGTGIPGDVPASAVLTEPVVKSKEDVDIEEEAKRQLTAAKIPATPENIATTVAKIKAAMKVK
jgi:hypothetical protein